MIKSPQFSRHNCQTVGKIVAELKKCGKFETVLVSSSQETSEDKVSTFMFNHGPKLKKRIAYKIDKALRPRSIRTSLQNTLLKTASNIILR